MMRNRFLVPSSELCAWQLARASQSHLHCILYVRRPALALHLAEALPGPAGLGEAPRGI